MLNNDINVRQEIWNLLRYFTFWLMMSFIDRLIFIGYFYDKMPDIHVADLFSIYRHGLGLDLSLAAYISALPFLLHIIGEFKPSLRIPRKILDIYTATILFLFALTSSVNINIYREWGDKVSERAVSAFWVSPKEAIASTSSSPMLLSFSIIGGLWVGGFFLYKWMVGRPSTTKQLSVAYVLVKFIGIAFVLFTCIRGGYGRATLNSSMAYYCEKPIYNHAAVNTHWAFFKDMIAVDRTKSPYNYFTQQEAEALLAPVFAENSDSTQRILTTQRPNVVLVILESFTAGLIESLGGEKGITPNFERLREQGLLFSQIYSAADRSDKGIIGVYSAFPAQGPESIIKHIIKHEELPGMGQEMTAAGYRSSFYYGGQSEFYNFKSYMLSHGNYQVVDQSSYKQEDIKSSWGAYDHVSFARLLQDLNAEQRPFFSTIFTISNHEPFDLETSYKFGSDKLANKFRSTAFYTDSVVYDFMEKAKKEAWYNNTLFIFVADHGHRLPAEKWDLDQPERFHIPLLFFGEVLKPAYRGKLNPQIGNQTDLVATLFQQLGLSRDRYRWSRDLLNPSVGQYAFFNSKDGFGIRSKEQDISFDAVGNIVSYKREKQQVDSVNSDLLNKAKAYYQEVYRQFLAY